jgi:hypothetical protein
MFIYNIKINNIMRVSNRRVVIITQTEHPQLQATSLAHANQNLQTGINWAVDEKWSGVHQLEITALEVYIASLEVTNDKLTQFILLILLLLIPTLTRALSRYDCSTPNYFRKSKQLQDTWKDSSEPRSHTLIHNRVYVYIYTYIHAEECCRTACHSGNALDSNLGRAQDTNYYGWGTSWLSSVPPGKFINCLSSYHSTLHNVTTDSFTAICEPIV